MTDIFQAVSNKYRNSPSIMVVFVAALFMTFVGINHFAEDTYSSYLGLVNLETAFDLNVQIFNWTYWTMSIAPQIASIIFFYIYLSDTDNAGWALWVSLVAQGIDFFADVWYRSDGLLLQDGQVALISVLLTFGYFTLGSEVFITIGSGLLLKLYVPTLDAWKAFKADISRIKKKFGGSTFSGAKSPDYNPNSPAMNRIPKKPQAQQTPPWAQNSNRPRPKPAHSINRPPVQNDDDDDLRFMS